MTSMGMLISLTESVCAYKRASWSTVCWLIDGEQKEQGDDAAVSTRVLLVLECSRLNAFRPSNPPG